MPELQVLNTLNAKRLDIEAYIRGLERDLEQARRDLSAILAAMKVFSAQGPRLSAYMNLSRLFPRFELPKLAKEAMALKPEGITTIEIATYMMSAKGMDATDRHMRKAVCYKAVQVLRSWERRGQIKRLGKRGTTIVWKAHNVSASKLAAPLCD